jgi:hypothetical protein
MARISAVCDQKHRFPYQKFSDLLTNWTAETRCERCGNPVHWYGEWPPPKTAAATKTEYFEVLKIILLDPDVSTERRLDEEGLGEDGYLPFLLVTQTLVGWRGSPRDPANSSTGGGTSCGRTRRRRHGGSVRTALSCFRKRLAL